MNIVKEWTISTVIPRYCKIKLFETLGNYYNYFKVVSLSAMLLYLRILDRVDKFYRLDI